MRKILFFIMLSAFTVSACSQSEKNIPVHRYGVNSSGGSLGIHTFRSTETLWSVSNAYRVDLRELLDKNNLSAPYRIKSGQRLKIPAPNNYTIKKGDTLYEVSRLFDTTTTELVLLNNLKKPYTLKAGQNIRLPVKNRDNIPTPVIQIASYQKIPSAKIVSVEREELPSNIKNSEEKISSYKPPLNKELSFIKPVSGQIISGFGPKADGLHNDGINIKAAKGDAVRAAESGEVVYNGQQIEGYGNMVLIRHENGYLTAYAHMDKVLIKNGDKIKRGQTIGTVGSTGNVKSPQLHFEIRKGRDALNPATKLKI